MSKSIEETSNIISGWRSPSNIALIKYWGKHGRQLPQNPSVSFTLSQAVTETIVTANPAKSSDKIRLDFYFESQLNLEFGRRISSFLESVTQDHFPFLHHYNLKIESSNSFPHSSGIASSASGFSALALCISDISQQINGNNNHNSSFYNHVSNIARLGSGSASRSVFPTMAVWGKHDDLKTSSDLYAIGIGDNIHPVFKTFHNDILIVSKKQKQVSSSIGHKLMDGNPYASMRYNQANHRFSIMVNALRNGDLDLFGKTTEDEALTLHALMMCSDPSFILMEPESLTIIKKIIEFRKDTKTPVFFTLDAGPNIHMLYPESHKDVVQKFRDSELLTLCQGQTVIEDKVGNGPEKII